MTPREKAHELLKKYINEIPIDSTDINAFTDVCKQCATICVDEILNDNPNIYDSDRLNHKYWKAVKQEIEKL